MTAAPAAPDSTSADSTIPTMAAFRAQALDFLRANLAEREPERSFEWGVGSDAVGIFHDHVSAERAAAGLAQARDWRARRFDAGFGWIDGDPTYGGRGLTAEHAALFAALERGFTAPDGHWFGTSMGMVAPTVAAEASPWLRRRYLPALHRGDLIGCQLFSEPGAGSDLAGVATGAQADGDHWIVTGQKVWTSGAQFSDLGLLLARTSGAAAPGTPKHQGLTVFLLDMHAPGVQVRPLRQMTGGTHFNEVFLDGVRVPDDHRIGEVGAGWRVAMTTLMNERASVGPSGGNAEVGTVEPERLIALLADRGLLGDPSYRRELAEVLTLARVAELTTARLVDDADGLPGPELSTAKLLRSTVVCRTADLVARALGPAMAADTGEWGTFAWSSYLLGAPGLRLGGGTDEVLRNVLGERVLGLPREPRTA